MRSIGHSKAACDEAGSDLRRIAPCETILDTLSFHDRLPVKIVGKRPPTPPQPM